ncbi:MAG TPA: hypothetical protein VHR45_11200 [Thermoanaerobaculia bacterium]|nr:hypothetical protein [Thermoanaerobaculia bacterium]
MKLPTAHDSRSRRQRLLEGALLGTAALLFARVCTLPQLLAEKSRLPGAPPSWLLPLDDAYIFVRYAQQAARGLPWQWSRGEPSTGASSWLFTWLLVPPHWVPGDIALWSRWSRLIGVLSLWLLGWAAARALRAVRLPAPWPLAGGLCLVWSGPIGFGAMAGMESATNAALVVLACVLWMEVIRGSLAGEPVPGARRVWALFLTALLPLARPENGALTLLAALALWSGRLPWRRWTGFAVLLPGTLLAVANRIATGYFQPAGAFAKSYVAWPFLPLTARLGAYWKLVRSALLPVYLGTLPAALWPPVGWLALATTAAVLVAVLARLRSGGGFLKIARQSGPAAAAPGLSDRAAGRVQLLPLAPLALAWLVLAALAPLSSHLLWQQMRHHHAGLALAWLLAFAGTGLAAERIAARGPNPGPKTPAAAPAAGEVRLPGAAPRVERPAERRWRAAVFLLPLPLLLAFPHWARESNRAATELFRLHAPAAAWLAAHAHDRVLLLTDAGLLSLAHDGPAIDALGLASPDLTEPSLHGPGALLESLARRRHLPEIAAVDPRLLRLPQLLGEPLLPGSPPPGGTVLARLRRELLVGTVLAGPGLDFAYLPDERRYHLRWEPPPPAVPSSFALLLPASAGAAGGKLALQGCRPLLGRLRVELPTGLGLVRLRATVLAPVPAGEVVAAVGDGAETASRPLTALRLAAERWSEGELQIPAGRRELWLTRSAAGVPCLESLRFFAPPKTRLPAPSVRGPGAR